MKPLLVSFLAMYVCWVLYLAIMNLKRARDAGTLSTAALVLGYPLLFVGYALDIGLNLTLYSVILWECPRRGEWTISARTQRWFHAPECHQNRVAIWIAVNLLNGGYDPAGDHIK